MLAGAGLLPSSGGGGGGGSALQHAAWLDDAMRPWNRFSRQPEMVKAALCAALAPNLASMDEGSALTDPPRW